MTLSKYPQLSDHIKSHKEFIRIYSDFQKEFFRRGADNYLAIHVEKVIWKWWEEHVLNEDMQYVPYLK